MNGLKLVEQDGLIKVYQTDTGEYVVDGRELWQGLGSKQDFSTWVKKRLNETDAMENEDYHLLHKKMEQVSGAKHLTEYVIKLDTAKEMAMLERNETGKKYRKYLIEVEKKYKAQLPTDYLSALKALVKSEEEKLALQVANKELEYDNTHKTKVIEGLTEDISLAEKRRRITDIVRHGARGNYQDRYRLLYAEFEMKYHIDLDRRMKGHIERGDKPKVKSKMEYVDKVLNMIPELYDIACKIFENDFTAYLRELEVIIEG